MNQLSYTMQPPPGGSPHHGKCSCFAASYTGSSPMRIDAQPRTLGSGCTSPRSVSLWSCQRSWGRVVLEMQAGSEAAPSIMTSTLAIRLSCMKPTSDLDASLLDPLNPCHPVSAFAPRADFSRTKLAIKHHDRRVVETSIMDHDPVAADVAKSGALAGLERFLV